MNAANPTTFLVWPLLVSSAFVAADGTRGSAAVEFSEKEKKIIQQFFPLSAMPPDPTNAVADDPRAARLGQFLFFDKRLSANGEVSCSTCHNPSLSFTDGKPLGQGMGQSVRHTAGLWNVGYNRWFFWDGRADTLWSQALRPIETENELGSSRLHVAHRVHQDAELAALYEQVFGAFPPLSEAPRFPQEGRPIPSKPDHPHQKAWAGMRAEDQEAVNRVFANVGKSIAAYERKIISRNSAFDRFAAAMRSGDSEAMLAYPQAAQRGLKLFIGKGNCRLCHSGPNFTDGEFHDTRLRTPDGAPPRDAGRYAGADEVLRDPFNSRGPFSDEPKGDTASKLEFLANSPQNWGLFKTPSLRNAAATAPYMHLGQIATLREVLMHYSTLSDAADSHHPERILMRLDLTDAEIEDLLAFLETLTDTQLEPSLLAAPQRAAVGSTD